MKNYIKICSVLLLFALDASCKGQNQTDLPKDSISPEESNLPNNVSYLIDSNTITTSYGPSRITRTIIQDSRGDILLASYEGIIKYDGSSFTNFTKKEGLDPCNAWSVLEDKSGNFWIATDYEGVYRYDGKSFTHFTTKEGLAYDRVLDIYEDKAGNIWFGTMSGASRFDGKSFVNFTTKEGLPHNDVSIIIEDKTGKFWIGTRDGACVYDGKKFTTLTNKEGAPFKNVSSIIEDKRGHIWLGGVDGLWRHNRRSFTNFTTDVVFWVYEDRKGNIWTTTDAWTNKDQPNPHKSVLSRYDEESLLNDMATASKIRTEKGMFFKILEDNEGSIWVGTLNGVFRYDGKSVNHFNENQMPDK